MPFIELPENEFAGCGLAETIDVLEKSKSGFRSKNLSQICKRLEFLLTTGRKKHGEIEKN